MCGYEKVQAAIAPVTYVSRSKDSAVPVRHQHVISVRKSITAGTIPDTLLALLELFHQPEVTRNYSQ